ncbi:MAG: transporter substrate-binding domain-containing protein [Jiangellales bacterium]
MARTRGWIVLPAVVALALTGCSTAGDDDEVAGIVPESIAEVGALVVATDPTFPPAQLRAPVQFQSVQQGELTGFEVDLVVAVADELGLDVEWFDAPFDQVLRKVPGGEVDLAASSITVTPERSAEVGFVTFFSTGTQWAVREPNTTGVTPNDACGARVAVQTGTIQADDVAARSTACQEAGDDPIEVVAFERQDEATSAVLAGIADAFVADAPAVQWAVSQFSGTQATASSITSDRLSTVGAAYDPAPYGWAVADPELAAALLEGLQAVYDSGEYDEILEFWGVSEGGVDTFEIVGDV